jgi:hypothetical protein
MTMDVKSCKKIVVNTLVCIIKYLNLFYLKAKVDGAMHVLNPTASLSAFVGTCTGHLYIVLKVLIYFTETIQGFPLYGDRNSVAGTATGYGLDGRFFQTRWWARDFLFSTHVHPDPVAHSASSIVDIKAFSSVISWPGCDVDHPPSPPWCRD